MFSRIHRHPRSSTIDLETVRATVSYMSDDARCTPGMERIATALEAVLREIDATEQTRPPQSGRNVFAARFVPFRR